MSRHPARQLRAEKWAGSVKIVLDDDSAAKMTAWKYPSY
jgi:hypothetical protein